MNYATLVAELRDDPLARGYSTMTDRERFTSLTTPNRPGQDRGIVPAHEVIEATVPADWSGLTPAEKQRYQTLVSAGQVNLRGPNTRGMLGSMFAAGTQTRTNLQALQAGEQISRAAELGFVNLGIGHLASARQQMGG